MSWSLQITDGDFRVDSAHLGTVIGQNKLVQDMTCAIMERMGTDNLHPEYGSLIDGGRTPDGVTATSVIGDSDTEMVALRIETELTRIARQLQNQQLTRAKGDKMTYGKATLSPQEVLMELQGVEFVVNQDQLLVTVRLITATGTNLDLLIPIDTNS